MGKNLTILIPTHERHHYLSRCVNWFLESGYPIIIADSSREAWESPLRSHAGVHYIHVPGGFAVYTSKILSALEEVKTPFMSFCADDDFIMPCGLESATDFLKNHPDFSFCQGFTYYFQTFSSRIVTWPVRKAQDIVLTSCIDRIGASNHSLFYGVNRTHIIKEAFHFLAKQDLVKLNAAAAYTDFTLTCFIARAGFLKRLSIPFGFREYSPNLVGSGLRPALILEPSLITYYHSLIQFLKVGVSMTPTEEKRLIEILARDLAGQIQHDLTQWISRRALLKNFPTRIQILGEYFYRTFYHSVKDYWRSGYNFSIFSIFFHKDFWKLKRHLKAYPIQKA